MLRTPHIVCTLNTCVFRVSIFNCQTMLPYGDQHFALDASNPCKSTCSCCRQHWHGKGSLTYRLENCVNKKNSPNMVSRDVSQIWCKRNSDIAFMSTVSLPLMINSVYVLALNVHQSKRWHQHNTCWNIWRVILFESILRICRERSKWNVCIVRGACQHNAICSLDN